MDEWDGIRQDCAPLGWATVYRILKDSDRALDCCQEVFLEALQRSKKAVVDDWPAFLRWLAVRRALDRLRSDRRTAARFSADYDVEIVAGGPQPSEDVEFRELVNRVRVEMARLPGRQAEAFWLCCVEEMTYDQAASQMGTDANSVGVLIHRARTRLRKLLADLNATRVSG